MLFENEQFHISRICSVIRYAPEGERFEYPGKLPSYELMLFIQGKGMLNFGEKAFSIFPGRLVYLPKGVEGVRYTITAQEPYILYNLYFDTPDNLPREPLGLTVRLAQLQPLYEKLYTQWNSRREGYYYRTMQTAYVLLEQLLRQQQHTGSQRFVPLQPAEEYLAEHCYEVEFDYQKMAQLCKLSYSYFKKLFIAKYGVPPVKHICRLRITRACELLQTRRYTVTQIAAMCGFENVYYFSNVFKKQMGVSPKKYISQ